jgi:hypothetical protein
MQPEPTNLSVCKTLSRLRLAIVLAGLTGIAGCGGPTTAKLGTVHGRVTMDGKPLAHAGVRFQPQDGGHDSTGFTDADGNYRLRYIRDIMGARLGAHKVIVSTQHDRAGKTETVPARYNTDTTLKANVVAGDQVINFDLTTN